MPENTMQQIEFAERTTKDEIELGTDLAPKFNADGTIPAITIDIETGDVVMFAFMNAHSLSLSIQTGIAHYWSRSRGKLWKKGETSGNMQEIVEMRTDCDQDVILIKVRVQGNGASCHQGFHSCFYRTVENIGTENPTLSYNKDDRYFDPKDVY